MYRLSNVWCNMPALKLHPPLQTSYVATIATITTKYPCKSRVKRIPRCRPHGPTCPFFLAASRVSSFPIGHVDTKKGQVGPLRRNRHLGTGSLLQLLPRLRGTTGHAPPPPTPFDRERDMLVTIKACGTPATQLLFIAPSAMQKARNGFNKTRGSASATGERGDEFF